ncbi:MAG: 3-oxoacyl-(Acyl-carrier-protein) reductase [Candidatus Gottesmanbacteria bacterium GW2011_GWB1_49_7]|uniref:3-oxoacyl-(Acyl-carrier-protein) reductase n=1 Tax=Candidatus Gottesmanbacteria bacterium GW2011_GWB1_49_7 TaxID=1618448 RepID=A0A0G1YVI8_9BACT|nr:MAG: 3-oxoacyl-(Acyl-carrier-protein) reductase [Candidatus Gottesmanbacteria bacterium GW2011_GWB1_49_7]
MKLLHGTTAMVTGSTRGIGLAIATEFAKNGATVILHGSKKSRYGLDALNMVKKYSPASSICFFDVANRKDVARECGRILRQHPKIDILVNNAGILASALLTSMTYTQWDRVIKTNLYGVFFVTKAVLPAMISHKYGRIINMSSIAATLGDWGMTNYGASKAGILGFTKSLSKEVARYTITVNAICPGLVDTGIMDNVSAEYVSKMLAKIPLRRKASAAEVAQLITFIASAKASYITGEAIHINGGWV